MYKKTLEEIQGFFIYIYSMRYIREFKSFEAIIIPNKNKNEIVSSFDDLVEYGKDNGFDVVLYDDFYNSLSEVDKKTAPPRGVIPFFALFHPIKKTPMFVINAPTDIVSRIPNFIEIVNDIIGHEKIHLGQSSKSKIPYRLPDPNKRDLYFSDKNEVMAFSWTIANGLSKNNKTIESAFNDLNNNKFGRDPYYQIWSEIKKSCDRKTINRYRKYIYMYLDKILN